VYSVYVCASRMCREQCISVYWQATVVPYLLHLRRQLLFDLSLPGFDVIVLRPYALLGARSLAAVIALVTVPSRIRAKITGRCSVLYCYCCAGELGLDGFSFILALGFVCFVFHSSAGV